MVPSVISTPHYTLRRFSRRDLEALYEAVSASLPELAVWLPWARPGYNRDDALSFLRESIQAWRDNRAFDYSIRRHGQLDRHIGNISIWTVSRSARTGEIGYWVRSDEISQGIATEATARMLRLGFEQMHLHKVTLRIGVGNTASERVAAKLGFRSEGILREELQVAGRWMDHTLFSLLDHEAVEMHAREADQNRP